MTEAPFRPFETHLDEAAALATLRAATDGADDGELFLERRRAESLVLDDGRLKLAAALRSALGVRVHKIDPPHEPIKHVFTHRIWMLWPLRADLDLADGNDLRSPGPLATLAPDETAWILPGERPVGGIPTVTQRLLERLGY